MSASSHKKVLIIGSGGREHALAWKAAQSPRVEHVFVAPGNGGTVAEKKCANIAIEASDTKSLVSFAKTNAIDITIVGPDDPLAHGVVDTFQKEGLLILGPTKRAAQLEWSKSFAKDFMRKYDIPTAAYEYFSDVERAKAYIMKKGAPIVVKADGLAAGKGVLVAENVTQAIDFVEECITGGRFGAAGGSVVIEEYMEGEEASYICICDGEHFISFPAAQDHKLSHDGDVGENTGGMGSYAPAPIITPRMALRIEEEIVRPIIDGMRKEDTPFVGFLYVGLMITQEEPRVVEINARFGDPEAQPILMLLESDFVTLCEAAARGELDQYTAVFSSQAALCVVMVSEGYPREYKTGDTIRGLSSVATQEGIQVFHAGTRWDGDALVTNGGRVLGVTALARTVYDARQRAYAAVNGIHWKHERHRNDIGWRAT